MLIKCSPHHVPDPKPISGQPIFEGSDNAVIQTMFKGDKLIATHAQDVDEIQRQAHMIREHSDMGFTKSREMQLIGRIPEIEFLRHPEFMHEPHSVRRWLNNEGKPYRTSRRHV